MLRRLAGRRFWLFGTLEAMLPPAFEVVAPRDNRSGGRSGEMLADRRSRRQVLARPLLP